MRSGFCSVVPSGLVACLSDCTMLCNRLFVLSYNIMSPPRSLQDRHRASIHRVAPYIEMEQRGFPFVAESR